MKRLKRECVNCGRSCAVKTDRKMDGWLPIWNCCNCGGAEGTYMVFDKKDAPLQPLAPVGELKELPCHV